MSVGTNGREHPNVDINLQTFFDHVFDRDGTVSEPTGCDTAYYLSRLDSKDMDAADKTKMIHTLWNAMDSVIRMQFGFDSLTHIMNEKAAMRAQNDVAMVQSSPVQNTESNEGA